MGALDRVPGALAPERRHAAIRCLISGLEWHIDIAFGVDEERRIVRQRHADRQMLQIGYDGLVSDIRDQRQRQLRWQIVWLFGFLHTLLDHAVHALGIVPAGRKGIDHEQMNPASKSADRLGREIVDMGRSILIRGRNDFEKRNQPMSTFTWRMARDRWRANRLPSMVRRRCIRGGFAAMAVPPVVGGIG